MSARDRMEFEYRQRLEAEAAGETEVPTEDSAEQSALRRDRTPEQQALWVDSQIRAAMARGEFDDLPGAGKPIPGIDRPHDPDWWVKRLIERERITGVLPEALALRKDDAELDDRLDRWGREAEVREILEDFNRRILAARRQLQGGPPVVTPLRDVDDEIDRWRARRDVRATARRPVDPVPETRRGSGLSPWGRRRARRRRTP